MRRSSLRTSGTGMPDTVSRSVGSTSGRTSAGGTIVVRGSNTVAMALPYNPDPDVDNP